MTTDKNLLETIGFKIKNLRQIHNITQEGMAEMLKMSSSNYAKLERGEIDMTVRRLQEIAKVFGTEVSNFVSEGNHQSFNTQNATYSVLANNNGTVQFPNPNEIQSFQKQIEMLTQAVQRLVRRVDALEKKGKKEN